MAGFSCEVDLGGAFAGLDEVENRAGYAVRPAAYEGAMVLRQEVETRAPKSEKAHRFYGRKRKDGTRHVYVFEPGSLKRSIYLAFNEEGSVDRQKAEYQITWRKNQAYGSDKMSVPYAYWVEFGNAVHPAYPFLRPAYDAKLNEAIAKVEAVFMERLEDGKADYRGD